MKTKTIHDDAAKIEELCVVLENIATDDGKDADDYTTAEVLHEAEYVLSLFTEGGTAQSEMLESDDPSERKDARKQMRQLKSLIKKWSGKA